MLNKKEILRNLIIFLGILAIICLIPLISYFLNFGHNGISEQVENWAQFGDYVGGLLNPILALFNIVLLIGVAYYVYKFETDREKQIQNRNIKPLCYFKVKNYDHHIQVILVNDGLGPAIINHDKTKIVIRPKNQQNTLNLCKIVHRMIPDVIQEQHQQQNIQQPIPNFQSIRITWKSNQSIPKYIGTKDEIILIELQKNSVTDIDFDVFENFNTLKNLVKNALGKISITLVYSDLFGNNISQNNNEEFVFNLSDFLN